MQLGRTAECGDQSAEILPHLRTANGEYEWLARLHEKAVNKPCGFRVGRHLTTGRSKTRNIGSRGNNDGAFGLVIGIQAVLLDTLLRRAGNDQAGMLQDGFLGSYSPVEAELALQCLGFTALCKQALLLASPERMAGMNLRDAQELGKLHSHIPCVGIMAVNDIRQALLL